MGMQYAVNGVLVYVIHNLKVVLGKSISVYLITQNMEENVALDSAKKKDFLKSVKGIKKLLKKKVKKPVSAEAVTQKNETKEVVKLKKRHDRGLVYLSHIPHGFYEHQMTEYFKQFGIVTNARVIRSRRTGKSKGYAFVEFKDTDVAQVVAETMNNYLMGKRLIKAAYIPPHKQRKHALRKKWNPQNNPSRDERLKFKKMHNATKTVEEDFKEAKKLLLNLTKTKKKLNNLGIDYDFFEPVDVPEALKDGLNNVPLTDKKPKKQVKTEFKNIKSEDDIIEIKTEPKDKSVEKAEKKEKKKPKRKQSENITSDIKEILKPIKCLIKNDNRKVNEENPEKEENNKLKKTGVNKLKKTPKNFISLKEADDSDSSIDFDSDEFEKMMENDDDMSSGTENTETENEDVKSDESEGIEESIKNKKNAIPVLDKAKAKSFSGIQKKQETSVPHQAVKRKNVQNYPVTDKKAKFEKQRSKKPFTKVIKKRT